MPDRPDLVLTFPEYEPQGQRLAAAFGCDSAPVDLYRFPDGEARVRLPAKLPRRVALCRSLCDPDAKLIELLLVSRTARELGAGHVSLFAPYLCYMRQDKAFVPGEAVSQRIIGAFLGAQFDRVVTVDPHLHRIERLDQALPGDARALSASLVLAEFLARRVDRSALLVGPDSESRQWVAAIAAHCGCEYVIAEKTRRSDRDVSVRLPETRVRERSVILVDDIVSTGHTLATVAAQLTRAGAARIDALVTHALFSEQAETLLRDAGVTDIWSTDSVPHASNRVELASLLASVSTATA